VRVLCAIGYVFAKLVSEGASALLGNTSTFLKEKSGMNFDVANVLKKVIFAFTFVPVLIVALETLQIRSCHSENHYGSGYPNCILYRW
jgi:hypothetical protein